MVLNLARGDEEGIGKNNRGWAEKMEKRELEAKRQDKKQISGAGRTCGEEKESNDGQRRKRAWVEKTRKLLEEEQGEVTGGGYEWQI